MKLMVNWRLSTGRNMMSNMCYSILIILMHLPIKIFDACLLLGMKLYTQWRETWHDSQCFRNSAYLYISDLIRRKTLWVRDYFSYKHEDFKGVAVEYILISSRPSPMVTLARDWYLPPPAHQSNPSWAPDCVRKAKPSFIEQLSMFLATSQLLY